jgi:hypothetical protein
MKFSLMLFLAAAANLLAEPTVEDVFQKLYSFDFAGSQSSARSYSEKNSADPMGYASLAASYLFSEMNRLEVFNKDMFKEEKVSGEQAKRIGREAKVAFEDALNKAKNAGEAALQKNPQDTKALLALMIATGAERDFAALVEKRYKDSYYAAKASQEYALRLQKIDGTLQDAWFTRGFSEYLVASVPFVIRWLMKMDQVEGKKERGVEFMAKAAASGNYLKPFAQMMLATIYQKDKKFKECRQMLEAFAAQHPGNLTVKRELEKLPKS